MRKSMDRQRRRAGPLLRLSAFAWTMTLVAFALAGAAGAQPTAASLRELLDRLLTTGTAQLGAATIGDAVALGRLYSHDNLAPLWSAASAEAWLQWIARIDTEGLEPSDYFVPALQALAAESRADPSAAAMFDLLLSASFLRASHDLRFGKVDPATLERSWNLRREGETPWDPIAVATEAIGSGDPGAWLERRLPRPNLYRELVAALARYRAIAAAGGWPSVQSGKTLHRGDVDPRVPVMVRRLAVSGDYGAGTAPESDTFDAALEQAVRTFQLRHGLDADGAIGPATLAALNVPVAARIEQIRLNLERGRWVFENLADRFLVVNIASFQVFLVEHDQPVWTARTVVGRYYRQTPTFRGAIQYLVLNPTWTVPPTILRQDVLPGLRKNPRYLQEHDMDVLAPDGRGVDTTGIDWQKAASGGFPYVLQQRAGPNNPLGRVKFMFPNEHFVYLHDTPSRALFDETARTFSSGCIRVEDALRLAELVLDDAVRWPRAALDDAVAAGDTRTVRLPEPLPILILYWTASVDAQGHVRLLPDIYRRDARVLAALDAPHAANTTDVTVNDASTLSGAR
jgi:murein L,D-transpeptidase YcbB/YkuD